VFTPLEPFSERAKQGLSATAISGALNQGFAAIEDAFILSISPPPVRGIGTTGGFKMQVQDTQGAPLSQLADVAQQLVGAANQDPVLSRVFTTFNTRTPSVYADIDRVRAEMLGVSADDIFETLEIYLGSQYVNDFNFLGRTYRVTAQADGQYRQDLNAIAQLEARNAQGEMVPLGSVAAFRDITGPYRVERFNLFPSAAVQGGTSPGFSSGDGLQAMERLAGEVLPDGYSYQWTELAFQEKQAGDTAIFVFLAAVVFVFLLLAAQYESWGLPLAVILIVPMCLLAAVSGLLLRGMSVNILGQVGFVVLIALAAKNAILIVEFARQNEGKGQNRFDAVVDAARVRLRPILMTALAFILGVVPLVIATGAGAEMRQSLGTAVFSGMLGVTAFGLIFTPIFYVLVRKFAPVNKAPGEESVKPAE
jgi:HAE1 family hydrophobic/amphiphilic exporter-1